MPLTTTESAVGRAYDDWWWHMPRDWWWGVLGNALGTVLGALLLGVLAEAAASLAPRINAIARARKELLLIIGIVCAFFALMLYRIASDAGTSGLDFLAAVLRFVSVVAVLLAVAVANVRLIARLLKRVGREGRS